MFVVVLLSMLLMQGRVRTVFAQCSVVTSAFFLLAPGFGPQYMAWMLPWTVAAGWEMAVLFQAAVAVFLFGMYNSWCDGIPWNFADANQFVPAPWVLPSGVAPWILLVPLIFQVCRKNWASAATGPKLMVSSQAR